jgi:hypothetical protein
MWPQFYFCTILLFGVSDVVPFWFALLDGYWSDPEKPSTSVETGNQNLVDFAIMNGIERLATCEALILEGKDMIDTHVSNVDIFGLTFPRLSLPDVSNGVTK